MKLAIWFAVNIIFIGASFYYIISKQFSNNETRFSPLQNRKLADKTNMSQKLVKYKHHIISELRLSLFQQNKDETFSRNIYSAHFSGQRDTRTLTWQQTLCQLKNVIENSKFQSLTSVNSPFDPELSKLLKESQYKPREEVKSCVIVSSAGSLLNSSMGSFIDNHDYVVRFNNAPTAGYEEDVGEKTSLRVVNSQVIYREEFQFTSSNLYKNVSLVAWDPSEYKASLNEWAKNPDFPFFDAFWTKRRSDLDQDLFLLDPRGLWDLWNFLSKHSPVPIPPNPPSSGFIGLILMLPWCNFVDMVEFVPSTRITDQCHYYDSSEDLGCTMGEWHPLAAEKLLAIKMNQANDATVFQEGYVRIAGFPSLTCS